MSLGIGIIIGIIGTVAFIAVIVVITLLKMGPMKEEELRRQQLLDEMFDDAFNDAVTVPDEPAQQWRWN